MVNRMFRACGSNTSIVREKTMFKETQASNLRLKLVAGIVVATSIGLVSAGALAQTGFTPINVTAAGTGGARNRRHRDRRGGRCGRNLY